MDFQVNNETYFIDLADEEAYARLLAGMDLQLPPGRVLLNNEDVTSEIRKGEVTAASGAVADRPVAREGSVVVRPMMCLALTYDHRIVDGREAVLFLRRVKEAIEDPARMLIEV